MSEIRFNRWSHQSGTGGIYQDSSGNIGIGTSTPKTALDIVGVISATSFSVGGDTISGSTGFAYDNTSNIFSCKITSLSNRTTGTDNFLAGTDAGCSITSGVHNNFLGDQAGQYNTSGSRNNFFGLLQIVTGKQERNKEP